MSGTRERVGGAPARFLIAVLALVFVLNAADPTPRFLGFSILRTVSGQQAKLKPVLPSYELPDGARLDAATSRTAGEPTAVSIAPARPPLLPGVDFTRALTLATRAPRLAARNGTGPPLRC